MANDLALKKSNELNNANILEISALVTNQALTANDDTVAGNVVGTIYINPETLLANDSDIDGDAIRGVSLQNAVNGEVQWDGVQVIFIPADGYSGPASFEYTITDDKGGYDSATVNLNIVANSAPVALDDSVEGYANTDIVIPATELMANDTDANGDALIGVSLQDVVNGTVSWDGENVTFTPDEGYEGPASFRYTIKDVHGETATATVNLTILANARPVAEDDQLSQDALVNQPFVIRPSIDLFKNDHDDESSEWAFQVISVDNATNGQVEILNRFAIRFTPDPDYVGPASFEYTMIDEQGSQSTATAYFNVSPNIAPVATDDNLEASAYIPLVISPDTLLANDSDIDGYTLTGVRLYDAENGKVEWDGENVIFTPRQGYEGPASFWYEITDGRSGYDQAKVNLTVKPYVGATDDHVIATHHDTVEFLARDLVRNDIGDGTKAVVSVQAAEHGSVVLQNGVIRFTPDQGYIGPAKFTYSLQDSNGVNDTATVNIEVQDQYARTVTTQSAYSLDGGYNIELDVPEHTLTREAYFYNEQHGSVKKYAHSFFGTIIGANWTTEDGFIGQASYDYSQYVQDRYASYTYGIDHAFILAGRVKINVEENVAPTANEDAQSGVVDQAIITSVNRLLANDIDPEGQEIKLLSVQDAINGTVELKDNNVIFTPTTGYTGDAYYTYTMIDRRNYQSTATVKLSIKAAADGVLTDEGETLSILEGKGLTVSADDPDSLLSNADGLNPYITSYTVGGSDRVYSVGVNQRIFDNKIHLIVNSDGSYELTNYAGNYFGDLPAIHYTVRDDNGNETVSTLNINITNVNDAPVVKDSIVFPAISMDQKQLITTTETLLKKYASDVDGDVLTVTSVHSGHLGTVELIGNEVYFTPNEGALGKGSFQYTVSDGNGGEDIGVYHLRVVETPEKLLVAIDDSFSVNVTDTLRIPAYLLERNDTDVRNDFRHTTQLMVHDAVNGTVELEGGDVVFRPTAGYSGPASFKYTIQVDEPVTLSTATVNLMVNVIPDEPVLVAQDDTIVFDDFLETYPFSFYELKKNDVNQLERVQDLRVEIIGQEGVDIEYQPSVINGKSHDILLTPRDGANGIATLQYSVTDQLGNIDTATVHLSFPQQTPPQGSNDNLFVTNTDESINIANAWLLKNDTDANEDELSIVSTQNAVNTEASLNGDQISFALANSAAEQASFQYSIHDGNQNYHFAEVDVSVMADGNFVGTETNDIMVANADNNRIDANAGDDIMIGGAGDDVLTGGLGADVFVWSINDTTPETIAVDRIKDFDLAVDKLDLQDLIQADLFNGNFQYLAEKQLADFLDFNVIEGNTEISIRDTREGEVVQKIVLENVLLPETASPAFPLSYDANLLIEFRENLIYT